MDKYKVVFCWRVSTAEDRLSDTVNVKIIAKLAIKLVIYVTLVFW